MKNKIFNFKIIQLKKLAFYALAIGVGVFFLLLIIVSGWIDYGVKKECQKAQKEHAGDCVEALSAFVEDENNTYKERNSAVWALGQLGDRRALPILKKHYSGEECQHDKFLCQYELKKAIKLAEGGFNITHFIWGNSLILDKN